MEYYQDKSGQVWGYDDTQEPLIAIAKKAGWVEVTGDWPPAPTAEQLAASARLQRDGLVGQTDWIVARHRDQVEGSVKTSLTSAKYAALMSYRQALRDVPLQKGFPSTVSWPVPPDWLTALTQP